MRPIEFISDETAQTEYIPTRIPQSVRKKIREVLGSEPDSNNKTDRLLLALFDSEENAFSTDFIADFLEVDEELAHNYVATARNRLKSRTKIFKILQDGKYGWYLHEKPISSFNRQQKELFSFSESAQAILRQIQDSGITLSPSQFAIVGVFADAGVKTPLTYEQVSEKSGYPISSVKTVISSINIQPWVITGERGQPKYLDCHEESSQ